MKNLFVVLMCVFLMAGVSFADNGNHYGWDKKKSTTIDNSKSIDINDSFNKTVKDNKIGINDNMIKDNNLIIGSGNKVDQSKNKNLIYGDQINGDQYNDKRMMVQDQNQHQGQNQGQSQGQNQSANNEGVTQDTELTVEGDTVEADKRDLIQGPVLSFPNAPIGDGKANQIYIKGSIFAKTKTLTKENLKNLMPYGNTDYFMGPDATVEKFPLVKLDKPTEKVTYGIPTGSKAQFVGTVYVVSKGSPLIALEALGADAAMQMGGTHLVAAEQDSFEDKTGSAAGISVGSNASGFAKGDDIAVAPGAMLGWSKVRASNNMLGAVMFDVYNDGADAVPPVPAK